MVAVSPVLTLSGVTLAQLITAVVSIVTVWLVSVAVSPCQFVSVTVTGAFVTFTPAVAVYAPV